jgi:CDP-diacylglycerol--glycerol-3-phosphate 3-phosphatidyltransferase
LKVDRVPYFITVFRLVALPFLVYAFSQEIRVAVYALFLFVVFTDFLDGYLARRFEVASRFGFYFDVVADFLFIVSMFLVFVLEGFYPFWILFLVVFVFAQFMLTSVHLKQILYDPVGKYYGSLMYGGVGLTLLFQEQQVFSIVTIGIVVSTIVTLSGRWVYFLLARKHKKN